MLNRHALHGASYLSVPSHSEYVDDGVKNDARYTYCRGRNVITPIAQNNVQSRNLERDQDRLVKVEVPAYCEAESLS